MDKPQRIFVVGLLFLSSLPLDTLQQDLYIPEDAQLNITSLATKYGLPVLEYDVTTEDGYILRLFHIPGEKDKTVLLMHGMLDSADSFVLRGRGSLAATLAAAGYDVWIANFRGTKQSRRHLRLDPDTDKSFWDFSFHEIGVYDLPAMIDFILRRNKVKQLSAVGHSQGNMIFYVLGSERPEYNDKVKVLVALGPAAYFVLENFQFPVSTVVAVGPVLNQVLQALTSEELLSDTSILMYMRDTICAQRRTGYTLCAGGLFQIIGEDRDELERDFFYALIGHFPAATSRKNLLHMIQLAERKDFIHFSYGPRRNLELYGSELSPAYDLKKVTMKVALFVGKNDKLTPINNVGLLRRQLPNVVLYHVSENPKFNHVDYVWGRNMDKYLFPQVISVLDKYSRQ